MAGPARCVLRFRSGFVRKVVLPWPQGGRVFGPPAQIALSLLPYAALGISEFMIVGVDRPREIASAGRETIALLRNSLARREAEVPQPGAFARGRGSDIHAGTRLAAGSLRTAAPKDSIALPQPAVSTPAFCQAEIAHSAVN